MANDIVEQKPTTPGFGVAGMVMCPFFKSVCMKQGCEMWVELKQADRFVARCSFAWLTILATETRVAIEKLGVTDDDNEVTN